MKRFVTLLSSFLTVFCLSCSDDTSTPIIPTIPTTTDPSSTTSDSESTTLDSLPLAEDSSSNPTEEIEDDSTYYSNLTKEELETLDIARKANMVSVYYESLFLALKKPFIQVENIPESAVALLFKIPDGATISSSSDYLKEEYKIASLNEDGILIVDEKDVPSNKTIYAVGLSYNNHMYLKDIIIHKYLDEPILSYKYNTAEEIPTITVSNLPDTLNVEVSLYTDPDCSTEPVSSVVSSEKSTSLDIPLNIELLSAKAKSQKSNYSYIYSKISLDGKSICSKKPVPVPVQ